MGIVGHGVDLVEVARIRAMLDEHGDRFLERCFTPSEREYGRGSKRYVEHLAARFAAKEAAMKAIGTGLDQGMTWHDVEVVRSASGQPRLVLRGKAAEFASVLGAKRWWVSLSHTDTHAIASVIAED
jgi:holo-[acyl-carrier protein] synthase